MFNTFSIQKGSSVKERRLYLFPTYTVYLASHPFMLVVLELQSSGASPEGWEWMLHMDAGPGSDSGSWHAGLATLEHW